jgi:hypothetical protein
MPRISEFRTRPETVATDGRVYLAGEAGTGSNLAQNASEIRTENPNPDACVDTQRKMTGTLPLWPAHHHRHSRKVHGARAIHGDALRHHRRRVGSEITGIAKRSVRIQFEQENSALICGIIGERRRRRRGHGWRPLPRVVGKSGDPVVPATYTLHAESTATAFAMSFALPPKYVEYTILPDGSSLVTNTSYDPGEAE